MKHLCDRLTTAFAIVGTSALVALVCLVCASIISRELAVYGLPAIIGDVELVEVGMAFVVCCFLPICQWQVSHARVDILTMRLGRRALVFIELFSRLLFAIALAVITWQMALGLISKQASGQTSFLLEFPVWWGYAACMPGLATTTMIAMYQLVAQFMHKDIWERAGE